MSFQITPPESTLSAQPQKESAHSLKLSSLPLPSFSFSFAEKI
ncbi:MAG: hypothetical protein ABH874_01155 [Methanobacteriota archaeon]